MDEILHTPFSPPAQDLLMAVCQRLDINEKQIEIINELGSREPDTELTLIESLFSADMIGGVKRDITHAVAFYKSIKLDRKIIKIPVNPGTYILQVKRHSSQSEGSEITRSSSEMSGSARSSDSNTTYAELLAKVEEPLLDLEMDEGNVETGAPRKTGEFGDDGDEDNEEEEGDAEEGDEEEDMEERQRDMSQYLVWGYFCAYQ